MQSKYLQIFINKYNKYGNIPNAIDVAKFIAIIIMVIDHLGYYFFPDDLWWRAIGRMSFPIWGFFAGYSRPSKFNYDIYVLFALLALVKTSVFIPFFPLNILATIIICRFYADFLRKDHKFLKWKLLNLILIFVTLIIWFPVTYYIFEYGTLALMFTICGVLQRERPGHLQTTTTFALATISFIFIEYVVFGFSVPQFMGMAVGALIIVHFLSRLKMKQFLYLEKFGIVTKAGMFMARNSLYFYFLHIVLFAILSKIIFPERYMHFKWL